MRRVWKGVLWLAGVVALVLVIGVGMGIDIWRYGGVSDPGEADAALVLGAAVEGNKPSPVFEERLRHAVDLYKSGQVHWLIMTGGLGAGDSLAEAAAGVDWALMQGVPESAILFEVMSHTTIGNFDAAKPLLAQNGIGRVLVVSDPLHMRRAMLIAASRGIDAYPSPTPTSRYQSLETQVPFLVREIYFTAKFLLLGTD